MGRILSMQFSAVTILQTILAVKNQGCGTALAPANNNLGATTSLWR
jgi:hypothetical protein